MVSTSRFDFYEAGCYLNKFYNYKYSVQIDRVLGFSIPTTGFFSIYGFLKNLQTYVVFCEEIVLNFVGVLVLGFICLGVKSTNKNLYVSYY